MKNTIGCFAVSSVVAACLLTSFCALWIPVRSLSAIEGSLFCTPPTCAWITWGAGISAVVLGVLGGLLGLWRNSLQGKSSDVDKALLQGFVLVRMVVGGIQGLLIPAMILSFLLGAPDLAVVLLIIFVISLYGQLLILAGGFATSPSEETQENSIAPPKSTHPQKQTPPNKQQFDALGLIEEIHQTLTGLRKTSPTLSGLPKGSWAARAILGHEGLTVEIAKNDDLLIAADWPQLVDETYWLEFIVPVVARLLARYQSDLPKGLKVRFRINSSKEIGTWSCQADELADMAEVISRPNGSGFGKMMALFDLE